jgi:hypothetical protein
MQTNEGKVEELKMSGLPEDEHSTKRVKREEGSEEPVLVSIIVPVYNSSQWLAEALQSVLEQTHRPLEVRAACSPQVRAR